MIQVNMLEAKTNLSKLVAQLESREVDYVIISRNGTPVAKIERFNSSSGERRKLGLCDGEFDIPDDIDIINDEILEDFDL